MFGKWLYRKQTPTIKIFCVCKSNKRKFYRFNKKRTKRVRKDKSKSRDES